MQCSSYRKKKPTENRGKNWGKTQMDPQRNSCKKVLSITSFDRCVGFRLASVMCFASNFTFTEQTLAALTMYKCMQIKISCVCNTSGLLALLTLRCRLKSHQSLCLFKAPCCKMQMHEDVVGPGSWTISINCG